MNADLERMWKKKVIAYFKILSLHFPEKTEGSNYKFCEGTSAPRFKPVTSYL
jgi:hypothetical protein